MMMQDAAWVLPNTPTTREQFQWLAAEISELKGTATLWDSQLTLAGQAQDLVGRFEAELEAPYRELLTDLKRPAPDLSMLSRRYQQLQAQDYFQSALGKKVRAALLAHRGGNS
jgi:hypothetical protein